MALDDNDRKEIEGLLAKALGVPEGKSITEHQGEVVAGAVNEILNKYDKGQRKEKDALKTQLEEIAGSLKELGTKKGDDDLPADPADTSKLPQSVREAIAKIEKQNLALTKELEVEKKAREEERAQREKIEAENERQKMVDTARSTLISKEIGIDPEAVDFALDHLEHRGLLRKSEDGKGYEMQHGTSRMTGDPEWHPLTKGLQEWAKGPGQRFLPAQRGGSPPAPPRGGGGARPAGALSLEDAQNLSSADLEKAIAEGRFTESSLEG